MSPRSDETTVEDVRDDVTVTDLPGGVLVEDGPVDDTALDDTAEVPTVAVQVPEVPAAPAPSRSPLRRRSAPAHRSERPKVPLSTITVVATLLGLVLVAVWFVFYAFVFSSVDEHRTQQEKYDQFRGLVDEASLVAAPIGGVIKPGTPVALLNTNDGSFDDLVVVEGTSSGDLQAGPGHQRNSPLPGQAGVSVLMGRSVTSGAPFAPVADFRVGTEITVTTGQGVFVYKVDGIRREGAKLPAAPAAGASRLTLVTSEGDGWRSVLAPGGTVWLDATLQGQTVAAPPDRPVSVPSDELPNNGDPSTWILLIFWLQALVLTGAAFTWAWYRWGRWQTYVVGVPVIVAVLWGTSATAMQLLPNLL